jgi:sporulation protein YlmC with PRC-barrel domain
MNPLRVFSIAPIKASTIIGTRVVDAKGDNLGDIKEIVIDPRSGRVAYAVVSFGGFLGLGTKLFAIPFSALEYKRTESDLVESEYVLKVSRERLQAAPGFDPDNWPLMDNEKWHRDLHDYYERAPYWV